MGWDSKYIYWDVALSRLKSEAEKYGKLIIAFDFDNTIYDYHNEGDTYEFIIHLLKDVQAKGHILVLHTARTDISTCLEYCKSIGLNVTNKENLPVQSGGDKPYYNLLLDDRAGLGEAVALLREVIYTTEEICTNI